MKSLVLLLKRLLLKPLLLLSRMLVLLLSLNRCPAMTSSQQRLSLALVVQPPCLRLTLDGTTMISSLTCTSTSTRTIVVRILSV